MPIEARAPIAPSASQAAATPDASAPPASRSAPSPKQVPFTTKAGDVAWVGGLPRAKAFRKVELRAAAPGAPLSITWRWHPARAGAKRPEPERPPARRFELVLAQGEGEARVDLGELSGAPVGRRLTYCQRQGYSPPAGEAFDIAPLPNLASAFSVESPQWTDDYLLVVGKGVAHLLHRAAGEGECSTRVKQGPLETCSDDKYERLSEIKLSGEAGGTEAIETVSASGDRALLGCKEAEGQAGPPPPP